MLLTLATFLFKALKGASLGPSSPGVCGFNSGITRGNLSLGCLLSDTGEGWQEQCLQGVTQEEWRKWFLKGHAVTSRQAALAAAYLPQPRKGSQDNGILKCYGFGCRCLQNQTNKCSTMPKLMSANNSKIIHLGDTYQALSFRMREAFNILAFTLKASQRLPFYYSRSQIERQPVDISCGNGIGEDWGSNQRDKVVPQGPKFSTLPPHLQGMFWKHADLDLL